jgi:predicted AlkP superfamily pyrophosphatase or phosphodiesterase
MKNKYLFIVAIFLFTISCNDVKTDQPTVLMVSFDGFRWDYVDNANTPNFDYLRDHGTKAESLQPVFPSKTFPNHYSLATGAYTGTHMLTGNRVWDKEFKEMYKLSDRSKVQDGKWYQAEPIWVTAERQGVKSASYFWVGSEAEIKGYRPSNYKYYDGDVPYRSRVDSVVAWYKLPEDIRPHLTLLYFSEPDHTGHGFGPNSSETIEVVEEMDEILGYLLEGLKSLDIANEINLIVLSDHGMTEVSIDRTIIVDDYISMDDFHTVGRGPVMQLNIKNNANLTLEEMDVKLKSIPHLTAYKKSEIPERYHFVNRNTGDFVLVAEEGWLILTEGVSYDALGTHGYDNELKSMHAIFYAMGPRIKENYTVGTFENIHVYPLICELLNIKPYANAPDAPEGRLEVLQEILK